MTETRPTASNSPTHLFGQQGELVGLRIPVEPRLLEEMLEALASLDFPVNPELSHHPGVVFVEFPAYRGHVEQVRVLLRDCGFDPESFEIFGILERRAAANG